MTKPRNPAADYAVYLAVRLAVCVLQAVPVRAAFVLADGLGWLAHRVDRRHRAVATDNLRAAFPDLDPAALDRLVRRCYRHYARVAVEMAVLPRKMNRATTRRYLTLPNGAAFERLLAEPGPVLIVTAHLGNWELAGFWLGARGHRTFAIARVLDNPHLERFLKRFRQGTGQTIIAKKDEFDRLAAVLRAGGKVATLGDQDAGPRGVFVNFFGRPASAHRAVALLATRYSARMVVIAAVRTPRPAGDVGPDGLLGGVLPPGEFHYDFLTADVIDPREYAGRRDAIPAITQRYHDALERLVRAYPEQFFWVHRRWKTQPVPAATAPALAAA